jgi:hypothetical protein
MSADLDFLTTDFLRRALREFARMWILRRRFETNTLPSRFSMMVHPCAMWFDLDIGDPVLQPLRDKRIRITFEIEPAEPEEL